jgi:eukaryotic-like serine/threonine-protein kinase
MADHQQQRYRVIDRLASGGMAEVFIAESAGIEGFKKTVAIKRVLPHLSEKKRFIAMFLDEARLSAHLSHSNVVQVFDIGVGDNTYFIVMEYVDGADLKQVIKFVRDQNKPFPVEQAVYICAKMCEGLAYAHEMVSEKGESLHVVHRDVSPPNVLLSKHGEIKIVDFGLAKASTQLEKSEAGIIKGKFSYLAPEAAHGHEVDARADIFAVGIILWEMLAGRRLFQGKTDYETVKQVQTAQVPSISKINRAADEHLESIIRRTLVVDREERYASARSLGRDLTRYLYRLGKPVSAFDIAELVRGPMQLRERGKQQSEGSSIIEKLIQETLFQFTSLQDKESDAKAAKAPVAGKPGGVSDTLQPFSLTSFEEFAAQSDKPATSSQLDIPALGNLASLEDDAAGRSARPPDSVGPASTPELELRESLADIEDERVRASFPSAPGSVPSSRMGMPLSDRTLVPSRVEDSGSRALKVLLLVVIAAGTAAAVWFSGLV